MAARKTVTDGLPSLTAEHRMLLHLRDELYEGRWEDFIRDLTARAAGRPYVFDTVTVTDAVSGTIHHHLGLIDQMQTWERNHRTTLRP